METCRQRGAGLVEIAVALLVLSIGTLGFARVQLAAMLHSHAAVQHSEAVFQAVGLLELVHSNPASLQSYELNSATVSDIPAVDCEDQSCDAGQWSVWNRWQWWAELMGVRDRDSHGSSVAGLLQPLACIAVDGRRLVLRLSWRRHADLDPRGCSAQPAPESEDSVEFELLSGEGG